MVAVPEGFDYARPCARAPPQGREQSTSRRRARHFAAKGVHVDLIKLYGSMELAPLAGLADAIVDLVSTGGTLKANKLVAVEGHHADLVAPGRQPGGAEDEARDAGARSRCLRRRSEEGLSMVAIKRLNSADADFRRARRTARLRGAQDDRINRRSPISSPT